MLRQNPMVAVYNCGSFKWEHGISEVFSVCALRFLLRRKIYAHAWGSRNLHYPRFNTWKRSVIYPSKIPLLSHICHKTWCRENIEPKSVYREHYNKKLHFFNFILSIDLHLQLKQGTPSTTISVLHLFIPTDGSEADTKHSHNNNPRCCLRHSPSENPHPHNNHPAITPRPYEKPLSPLDPNVRLSGRKISL